ncbi:germ cell nuclear acidic protein isoform X1 [Falco biarmicus]|uniref:acidic repeat-containing protein isoform X1 n=2 Tax=Falco rusticolus TaxID=120794 RepID=UPI00188658CE|nr:acidic repeat-containing protein isoform X1 [Falco rusticolus]XP_056215503.1 germ cell nuclear acidic protein isoform X1 [Falco biarmicus]
MERVAPEEAPEGTPPLQRRPLAHRDGKGPVAATPRPSHWGDRRALYFSSSSDDEFEMFLARMKTPKSVSKKEDASLKDFIDDLDDFWDFEVRKRTTKNAQKGVQIPKKLTTSGKKNTCCQELQYSEASSDSEDSVFLENSWHDYQKGGVKDLEESRRCMKVPPPQNLQGSISRGSLDLLVRRKERSCEESTENRVPAAALQKSKEAESDGSDDDFESVIERIRKRSVPRKPVLSTSKTVYQPSTIENIKPPCEDVQPLKGEGVKTPRPSSISLQETPSRITASARIPRSELVRCSQSAKTEKRLRVCSVPGCFLQDLSNPASHYVKYFKKNKEELTQKLYCLYNSTIFEQKLPEKMAINWNKKMRRTAGYCVTGQTEGPEAKRYARIELSEKVCDSADRLRDTLIHEACHAATWLINGVRDGHGRFWRFYANKSAKIHPELPIVTRCHSYEINYKFIYECVLCKATIGRHSKSLDTDRFVCAFCGGQLVLNQPTRKDGTPARTHLTPFAKYVKENYGLTKREQYGLSHAEVMRKLSADFALKTRLQDSL